MPSFLDPSRIGGALLLAALFSLAGVILSRLIHRLGKALREDRSEHIDLITLSFLGHLAVLVTWVLLLTVYAHLVPALNRLKPFERGDRLQIQAPTGLEVGEVEDISLGYTVLHTDDHRSTTSTWCWGASVDPAAASCG